MDALEFYIGELEDALAATSMVSIPDSLDPQGIIERLKGAARGVIEAWDAENTPEAGE